MSDIDFDENNIGSENISDKNNNNSCIEDKVCPHLSFDHKSCSDVIEPFDVQSDSDSRSNKMEIDSDIENTTPPINTLKLAYFNDNTSISCLESENKSNSDLDVNTVASNTYHEDYDGVSSTILSNVISTLNHSVPAATIVKIGNSSQPIVLNAPKSNPTENAKINVTTSGVGVLNIGDQFNGTNVNVIYCQEPKSPTVILNSNENAYEKPKEPIRNNRVSGIACSVISIIVILIIIASVIIVKYEFWDRDSEPENPTSPIEPNVNHSFNPIYRNEWHARPAESNVDILRLPIEIAIIAHTATPWCENKAACIKRMQNIQTYHMDDCKYGDIGYNFVVGGDGNIYVGRGWYKQGAHTAGWNNKSICIAFIGDYGEMKPTEKQLEVTQLLLAEGVERKFLSETYRLYGHCQLKNFLSPGINLYNIIKTWDHWTSSI